jgi:hypothetical protein
MTNIFYVKDSDQFRLNEAGVGGKGCVWGAGGGFCVKKDTLAVAGERVF